jgi:hypothetical protein
VRLYYPPPHSPTTQPFDLLLVICALPCAAPSYSARHDAMLSSLLRQAVLKVDRVRNYHRVHAARRGAAEADSAELRLDAAALHRELAAASRRVKVRGRRAGRA